MAKRLVSKTNPARSTRAWPAIHINLLNNKKSFCQGIEFNTDKWRLYHLLTPQEVDFQIAYTCANCWIINHLCPCGNLFHPEILSKYMLVRLKKYRWKNENKSSQ